MSINILGRHLNSAVRIGQRVARPCCSRRPVAVCSLSTLADGTSTFGRQRPGALFDDSGGRHQSSRNLTSAEESTKLDSPGSNEHREDDDGGPVESPNLKAMTNEELLDLSTIPGWDLVHNPPRRNPRGALVGTVVSDKMQKTATVAVDRYRIVPKYRKRLRYTKKFFAHDEHEVCNTGDLVMIVPCQKISRHKHFMVREIIRAKGQL
ncbi:hypothetical protein THAOC_05828 [Thalassiosira oceanica]|uniref:30S ribosomal protein S17, chloroplastic n=1 Tax=Thalassiosira oceanica TaxID=159749 RepID=K0TME0_THAOC|nr:hypothetical protein THAOC_05828 [Thalassiosira oceanica]|mmetsp:Transcript_20551/g.48278  ORF Transcript_20551/g.48278 Transcript_20551/m.48278 type:complete len:208 (-) Transcript_20551:88-711(-)|eukprot:EJK72622.1 hypothetical protein THAOC_05828 [Thalassiosira oceanica]